MKTYPQEARDPLRDLAGRERHLCTLYIVILQPHQYTIEIAESNKEYYFYSV